MSMKTILVPTERHDAMRSALETALLLARQCGSYIEGFALRWGIDEFVAVDMGGWIPPETHRQDSLEEAKQARQLFEYLHARARCPARERGGWLAVCSAGSMTRRRATVSSAATGAFSMSS